jgi:hypothetical protein
MQQASTLKPPTPRDNMNMYKNIVADTKDFGRITIYYHGAAMREKVCVIRTERCGLIDYNLANPMLKREAWEALEAYTDELYA